MPPLNAIIDLSHHNGDVDLGRAAGDGILGLIQKATQGNQYADPTYETNKTKAGDVGLYWGAYHFGTGGDGIVQADHFLTTVQPDEQTLLLLDFEANPQGPSMVLEEARAFLAHIHETAGRWSGL